MTARIKITGYLPVEDLEPEDVDLESPTGLSEDGYDDLVNDDRGTGLKLTSLEDVRLELEL